MKYLIHSLLLILSIKYAYAQIRDEVIYIIKSKNKNINSIEINYIVKSKYYQINNRLFWHKDYGLKEKYYFIKGRNVFAL